MACSTCNDYNGVPIFTQVEQDDGEYYIEDMGGSWSIITPTTENITNLFQRPSFENSNDASLWSGGSVTTADAYSGAYSYTFASQAQFMIPLNGFGINLYTPGNYYCISAMVKACCGSTITMSVGINWKASYTATGCWQQVNVCTSPVSPPLIPDLLTFTVDNCAASYVDAITVVSGANPAIPFDGDTPGVGWTGTPHASSSLMFGQNRFGGSLVRLFDDLGFRTIAYTGHGLPPVNLPTTAFARRSGARQQRPSAQPRSITITGELCACNQRDLALKRLAMIEALNINLDGTCKANKTMTIQYDCLDNCGNPVGEPVRIEAAYSGGLDGQMTRPFCERISLLLVANNDPLFYSARQHCKVIPPNTNVTVNNGGNGAAQVTLFARNRGAANIKTLQNLTNNGSVGFGDPVLGYNVPPGEDAVFRNAPGYTSFRLSDLTYINDQLNVSNNSKPSLFNLQKGDNVIRIDGTVSGAGSQFVLCWREKYLSSDSACKSCG